MIELILTLSILIGQLIKIPLGVGGISILDLAVLLLTIWGLINLKFRLTKPPSFLKTGLVFTFIALTSSILSPLQLDINERIISFMYLVRFLSYLLLGWIITSNGFKDLLSQKFFIISGVLLSIIGIFQILIYPDLGFLQQSGWDPHFYRAVSTFLDPNFLGAFLVISLLLIFQNRAMALKWYIFSCILIFLALLLTFSRSSYLMFFISTLTLGILQKSKKIILTSIVLSAMLLGGFHIYTLTVSEPRNIDRTKSATFRINTWQQGLTIFQQSPILGVGYNNYRYALKEYNLAGDDFLSSHGSTSNDSSLLFVLATTGVVGLLSFLTFLYFIAKNNEITSALILGVFTHSIFNNSLFYPPILLSILLFATLKFPKK